MADRSFLEQFRLTPEGQALLRTLRFAEGTERNGPDSYRVMYGGGLAPNTTRHPDVVVNGRSSAAGAYQFLTPTWKQQQQRLNLESFGPLEQDIAALDLARQKTLGLGGLSYLKERGLTPEFVNALAGTWASLPTSEGKSAYGQPVKSFADLQRVFDKPNPQPTSGTPTQQTQTKKQPFNFKEAMNDILQKFAVKSLGDQSSDFSPETQKYLALATDSDSDVSADYEDKALQAMFLQDDFTDNTFGLLKDVLDLKRKESQYNLERDTTPAPATQGPAGELMSIVDLGKRLQEKGFRVREHPEFGGVGKHSPSSHHYAGHALDITDHRSGDWKMRTRQLGEALYSAVSGAEVYHPGRDAVGGHETHVHFAMPGGKIPVTDQLRKLLG